MAAHAACSPSSAAMWLNCPASVTLTKDLIRPSSKYAREGTAAHTVAEMILRGDIFLPDKVTVENEEFIVSISMARALRPYVAHVQSLLGRSSTHVIEQRVAVPGTRNLVWGTVDFGVHSRSGLHIVDLKYGKGVPVDPESPQLKLYGLGLAGALRVQDGRTNVTLTVCQPRVEGGPLRSYSTKLGNLVEWREQVVRPAIDKIHDGDPTEKSGAWCRWCVRKQDCNAFNNRHQTHAASAFDDGEAP